jgi:malic enzyme
MDEANPDQRPVVFPMSNPISKMECTSEEAVVATRGRAVFASGSPQPNIEYEGRNVVASQANNMYIFPGVALGAYLGDTRTITDSMLMRAAVALPSMIKDEDLSKGYVYPCLKDIREITAKVAAEVIKQAAEEGRVRNKFALERLQRGDAKLIAWIEGSMFKPSYASLVQVPIGVDE